MLKILPLQFLIISMGTLLTGCATQQTVQTSLAPLPEPVTSFGAVTDHGWLYVFGGHKGERHDYSMEMVSGSFERLNLKNGFTWQELPASTPGQGLALVAHDHYLYRIGGMAARNHASENDPLSKQKLYSLSLVQRFDLDNDSWETIAPLPSPRSSLDAVVLNNKIYVAGGWDLSGQVGKPFWHTNALVLDLNHPKAGWQKIPQPFERRGLALAALDDKVFCIGGMDSNNDTSLAMDIYDTSTGAWTKGPDLPDGRYKGFSCSAVAQNGSVYVTTFKGDLLRLSADEKSWEVVGYMKQPRLAHRLVTAGTTRLIALGGEDGEEDKTPGLELLTPSDKPLVKTEIQTASTKTH